MARRLSLLATAALLLALLLAGAYALTRPEPPTQVRARVAVAEALGGDSAGFARALAPVPIAFPTDHGPHPGYRTEWWYVTGNLATAEGRRFGYQLTFFRVALAPQPAERQSPWAANQVYMAHFALTDVDGGRFRAYERFARAAHGLAGAQAEPVRVWLEDWSAEASPGAQEPFPGLPALRLRAAEGDIALDLLVESQKPAVLQGERGLSQKGAEPGNASYYYSLTRLATSGTVRMGEQAFGVTGGSWLDREWGTSALGPDQVGWDWFALQLDDGREVMFYRLRRRDGTTDPFSGGTLVAPDGTARRIQATDVRAEPLDYWQSPRGGRYPARWRLAVPGEALELEVAPYLPDQELDVTVRYWEGAVKVTGTSSGRSVRGEGYLEMTGYGDTGLPR